MTSLQATTLELPKLSAEEWAVQNEHARAAAKAEARARRIARVRNSGIPSEYFEADIRECNEAVKQFARDVRAGLSPQVLVKGKVGRGKTYSACAALLACSNAKIIRFVQSDMLSIWGNPYNTEGSAWVDRCKGTQVLAIDDLGKETPDKNTLLVLWGIVNHRLYNNRPTIITTQFINGLGSRLGACGEVETAKAVMSRFEKFETVVLVGEDRRRDA